MAVVVAWALAGVRRVEVTGTSMAPTLAPGDRLVVVPARRPWRPPRPGDLVVVDDPRRPSRSMVKRLDLVDGSRVRVAGDNPSASTDSRVLGDIPWERVVGRAVYRYAPPSRAGAV